MKSDHELFPLFPEKEKEFQKQTSSVSIENLATELSKAMRIKLTSIMTSPSPSTAFSTTERLSLLNLKNILITYQEYIKI